MSKANTPDKQATQKAILEELKQLNRQRLFLIYQSLWRLFAFQLLKGIAFGLGSILGASLVLSLLLYLLSQLSIIPMIGDWAQQIIEEIQAHQP